MPRTSFTTYTSWTTPTNVSSGTILTASRYNASLGSYGNLQYLYESLSPYLGSAGYYDGNLTNNFSPVYADVTLLGTQSIANSTWTTIEFDTPGAGISYFFSPTGVIYTSFTTDLNDPPTKSVLQYPPIPQHFLVTLNARFATNQTGSRWIRVLTGTNGGGTIQNPTLKRTGQRTSITSINPNNNTINETFEFLYTPSGEGQSITFVPQAFQNSGGALSLLSAFTYFRIVKLPRT